MFEFPWRIGRIAAYYRNYWLSLSETLIFLLLAIGGWALLEAPLGDISVLSWGWVGIIYAMNFGTMIIFAGGFHLFFYALRKQGDETKYVMQFGHRGGGRFTFGNQVHDNMCWLLASCIAVWTRYSALLLWAHANRVMPAIYFAGHPVLLSAIVFCTGMWVAFYFYCGHRLLHVGQLYRYVHSLHHRNVNIGHWFGISMQPVEHVIYFSSMLIYLAMLSNPVLIMFQGYMLALSAIFGHTGFHELMLGNSRLLLVGHFHHQLHHRYSECNYGSVDFSLDVWFGTFHDGTVDARRRLKEQLGPR